MLYFKEFKSSLKKVSKNKEEYLFLFFQLIVFSDMIKQTLSDEFLIINLLLTIALLIRSRVKFRKVIFYILIIYVGLCIYPVLRFGFSDYRAYLGYGIRILNAALILNYFRIRFIEYFENIVFLLAYISIPLFAIQLINPHVFDFMSPFSKLFMTDERMWYRSDNGITMHQYCLLFVFNGWAQNRNSGFMWEPAAYGAVLTWAIIFNLFINNFKHNPKLSVLIIAGLTTFSLGFYIYSIVFFLIYVFQNGLNPQNTGKVVLVIATFIFLLTQTSLFEDQYELVGTKLKSQSQVDKSNFQMNISDEGMRVNRIEGYYMNIEKLRDAPFGYGMYNEKVIYKSANGLVDLITKWGIVGFFLIILCYYRNVKILKMIFSPGMKDICFYLIVLLFILPLGGNPFYNKVFVFTIMLWSMYITVNRMKINYGLQS